MSCIMFTMYQDQFKDVLRPLILISILRYIQLSLSIEGETEETRDK